MWVAQMPAGRRNLPVRLLSWICLLVVQAGLAYALNSALVSSSSSQSAQVAPAERSATPVLVREDDSGRACNGGGCGRRLNIVCSRWVPLPLSTLQRLPFIRSGTLQPATVPQPSNQMMTKYRRTHPSTPSDAIRHHHLEAFIKATGSGLTPGLLSDTHAGR